MASSKLEVFTQFYDERRLQQQVVDYTVVLKKFLGDAPFRSDIQYHGVAAQVEVVKLTNEEITALGISINPYDVKELFKNVGVLVDEEKNVVFSELIADELFDQMNAIAKANTQLSWKDVKHKTYINNLIMRDNEIQIVSPISEQQIDTHASV